MKRPPISVLGALGGLGVPLLFSLCLSFLALATGAGLSGVSAFLIATAATMPGIAAIQVSVTLVRTLGIARGALRYLERLQGHDMALSWSTSLRLMAFDELAARSPQVSQEQHGKWLSRIVQDIDSLRDLFVRGLQAPLSAATVFVVAGLLLWPLGFAPTALVLASGLATGALIPWLFLKLSKPSHQRLTGLRGHLVAAAMDLRDGRDELLVSGGFSREILKLGAIRNQMDRDLANLALLRSLRDALATALSGVFISGLVFTLLGRAGSQTINPVILVTVVLSALALHEIFNQVPEALFHLDAHRSALGHLKEIDQTPLALVPQGEASVPAPTTPRVLELKNVSYRYPGAPTRALHNVSLVLKPGSPITLLGPSGSGKSTLLALLQRAADPELGTITLAGLPLTQWQIGELRQSVALVAQTPWFSSGTVAENLLLGDPHATAAQMKEALEQVGLSPWLESTGGLDASLGPQMSRLSGGERQRLALARALIQKSPVILLDESDAHLDRPGSHTLAQKLRQLAQSRLILRITHGGIDLQGEDRVILLSRGEVVADGPFHQLFQNPKSLLRALNPREASP